MSSNQTRLVKVGNVVLDPSQIDLVLLNDDKEPSPRVSILLKNHEKYQVFTGSNAEALRLFFEDLSSFGE